MVPTTFTSATAAVGAAATDAAEHNLPPQGRYSDGCILWLRFTNKSKKEKQNTFTQRRNTASPVPNSYKRKVKAWPGEGTPHWPTSGIARCVHG